MFESNADHMKLFYCLGILILCSFTTAFNPIPYAIQPPLGNIKAPYWNKETASLYFVGQDPSTVHRYHPDTNKLFSAPLDTNETISFVMPLRIPKIFAAGLGLAVKTFMWDGSSPELITIDHGFVYYDSVLIAGNVDVDGYLWVALENGDLFSMGDKGQWNKEMTNAGKLYGYAWSVYNTKIYILDSDQSVLMQCDFPISTPREPPNGTVVFDFNNNGFDGIPKGINVDDQNHAWVSLYGSDKILRIDTGNGKVVSTVRLPGMTISSLAFGGSKMDVLFVTTVKNGSSPDAGCLFRVTGTESKGLPSESPLLVRLP